MATDTPPPETAPAFNCELNEEQAHLRFPSSEEPETFGLVTSDAEWRRLRNDPKMLVKGMPAGIGEIKRFERQGAQEGTLTMPDGREVTMWSFRDGATGDWSFPAAPIRVNGGDLAQVTLKTSKRVHTIHHHGIEPDMDNDGVGHTSFEVSSEYTYQWRAHPTNCGTYFYHCHVNTALHVQMGMFGALIIDPYEPTPVERRKPLHDAPESWRYKPEHERIWALYSLDPVWHELNHDAGLCGEDVGLNNFNPQYFFINRFPQTPDNAPIHGTESEPVSVEAPAGENVLIRLINGQYHPVDIDFGDLPAYLIETDGRGLRNRIDLDGLGAGTPLALPPGQYSNRIGSAERFAILIRGAAPGVYPVTLTYRHWITKQVLGVARTEVRIT